LHNGKDANKNLLYNIIEEEEQKTGPLDIVVMDPSEPMEREKLPWFKDPKQKFSVWKIIKDSIGQELTRITLPVYLSQPVSALQMQMATCEYLDFLDLANKEMDPVRRLALVSIYLCV
jgi:hypothetical protein